MVTQISCVMLNDHDVISLIENYLDKTKAEYQSFHNRIEIYQFDRELIVIEIDQNSFSISYDEYKYKFDSIDQLFNKLNELLD